MSFKAKVSIDVNGVKEERSVLFIQTLLLGRTKNNIDKGTTQSNIDGYIELLDSSNRINGKITVQVNLIIQFFIIWCCICNLFFSPFGRRTTFL